MVISKLVFGNCLEEMKNIPDDSIDCVIADIPFGTTACKWDSIIPLNIHINVKNKNYYLDDYLLYQYQKGASYKESKYSFNSNSNLGMWEELKRIIKGNGAIILFSSSQFSPTLLNSNKSNFKYRYTWEKNIATNFLHAHRQPLRKTEDINVFHYGSSYYYPIKTKGHKPTQSAIGSSKGVLYQGTNTRDYIGGDTTRFPVDVLKFNAVDPKLRVHPTQKPIALMEYLVKTYSNEGDTILDFTCGSGSTIIASNNLNRHSIGIDNGYCETDKTINNISLKGLSWVDITRLRLDGKL